METVISLRTTIALPLTVVTLIEQTRPVYQPKVSYRLCTYCGQEAFGGDELTCECDALHPGPNMVITSVEIAGEKQE